MHFVSYFELATAPHQHHKRCSLWLNSNGRSPGMPPSLYHHRPPPLPGEGVCVGGVGDRIPSNVTTKLTLLLGLEKENMMAGWASKLADGQWTSCGPEQPSGNLRCPRWQQTRTALAHSGPFWPILLVIGNEDIMQGVKEGDNVGSIVRTKSGMMMKDTLLTNGCTHWCCYHAAQGHSQWCGVLWGFFPYVLFRVG